MLSSWVFTFFFVFGALKQHISKCDLSAGECSTKYATTVTLTSVGLLRHAFRREVVEESTYSKDFCKSFKIVESNCGQFTLSQILISCLKCDTESGSWGFIGKSVNSADGECESLSSPSDSPSSSISRVTRNTEGVVSFDTGSVVTNMLEASWAKRDMNLAWWSLPQCSWKRPST